MTTFIYGAYGTGNLGDDALLKAALERYGRKNVKVVSYGEPFLEDPIEWIEHFAFIRAPKQYMNEGDRLVFSGGGLFWAASHASDMAETAKAARELGCRVDIDRIGAQGVHCNLEAAKEFFGCCETISFRDQDSVDIVEGFNLTDIAQAKEDPVLSIIPNSKESYFKTESNAIKIGINHSATPFFFDQEHREKTLRIYNEIVKYHSEVEFYHIPHTRHFNVISQNDIINGEYFWKFTGGRIESLPFPKTVEELISIYDAMDGVIGWRYHMMIMATICGKPSAHLGQLGMHKYGAFSRDHKLPQINFDLEPQKIINSACKYIQKVIDGVATIPKINLS